MYDTVDPMKEKEHYSPQGLSKDIQSSQSPLFHVAIQGVVHSAKPLIVQGVLHGRHPVFVVAHSQSEAQLFSHSASINTQLFDVQPVPVLYKGTSSMKESNESQFYQKNRQQMLSNFRLISSLSQHKGVALSLQSVRTLFHTIADIQHHTTVLSEQSSISFPELLKKLEFLGYEHEQRVAIPGTFHKTGGHLDVFPIHASHPFRIELFGNKIERIRAYHPQSNILKQHRKKLRLAPTISLTNSDKSLRFPDFQSTFVFLNQDIFQDFLKIIRKKNHPLFLRNNNSIIFEDFPRKNLIPDFTVYQLDYQTPKNYRNNMNKILKDLGQYRKKGFKIFVGSHSLDRLSGISSKKLLSTTDRIIPLKNTSLFQNASSGWMSKKDNLIFLTDHELFGTQKKKKKRKPHREHQLFIANLALNEYVVHTDHGIGKFIGTTRKTVEDTTREYFVIAYAEGDKIFLPAEYAEKINRYIGSPRPTIHRLSSSSWHQLKRTVKKESKKIAKELLALYAKRELESGHTFIPDFELEAHLADSFEYEETEDQKKVLEEIFEDMERDKPMDRLLCGDVGFGKTEIAIRAAFRAVINQKQVAILCPTTLLAQQHFDTFKQRLSPLSVFIEMLSRFRSKKDQATTLKNLQNGSCDVVIGTHRLLSKDVQFKNLGLVIVDEEQRFGVLHKERLKQLRAHVDILTLSATPIPRTLNLALSGVRDISTIETPPPGRNAIDTTIVQYDDSIIKKEIERALSEKDQVYMLHNRVETIHAFTHKLQRLVPRARFGIAHGQMNERLLAKTMEHFDNRKIDVLVCSTIIENGLDLPNVNTLLVHNAPQFGLSQLYQIRGRVGRGLKKARSFFFYSSIKLTGKAKERLRALLEAKELGSGLEIATRDLEIRGAGNILGKEQSGQVSAVGLHLYTQLLDRSVEELRSGKQQKPVLDVTVDLPLKAYIPQNTFGNEKQRYRLYQRLTNMTSIEELDAEYVRLDGQQFSNISLDSKQCITNFFTILRLKLQAREARILKIDTVSIFGFRKNKKRIILEFAEPKEHSHLYQVLKINPYWKVSPENMKIDMQKLGKQWIKELSQTIDILC